jgi:hypothetical protein
MRGPRVSDDPSWVSLMGKPTMGGQPPRSPLWTSVGLVLAMSSFLLVAALTGLVLAWWLDPQQVWATAMFATSCGALLLGVFAAAVLVHARPSGRHR